MSNKFTLTQGKTQQTFVLVQTSSRRLDQDEYIRLSHTSSEDVFKRLQDALTKTNIFV